MGIGNGITIYIYNTSILAVRPKGNGDTGPTPLMQMLKLKKV